MMTVTTVAVLCSTCGGRLARDNTATVCSPCRRTRIEASAHSGSLIARDGSRIRAAFDSSGLYGVAQHLECSPEDALDVLLSSQLVPFANPRRRLLLRRLVALGHSSHIAAGEALNIGGRPKRLRRSSGLDACSIAVSRLIRFDFTRSARF
jgi:hypothetical protein